jgi:hypothetical protein
VAKLQFNPLKIAALCSLAQPRLSCGKIRGMPAASASCWIICQTTFWFKRSPATENIANAWGSYVASITWRLIANAESVEW